MYFPMIMAPHSSQYRASGSVECAHSAQQKCPGRPSKYCGVAVNSPHASQSSGQSRCLRVPSGPMEWRPSNTSPQTQQRYASGSARMAHSSEQKPPSMSTKKRSFVSDLPHVEHASRAGFGGALFSSRLAYRRGECIGASTGPGTSSANLTLLRRFNDAD